MQIPRGNHMKLSICKNSWRKRDTYYYFSFFVVLLLPRIEKSYFLFFHLNYCFCCETVFLHRILKAPKEKDIGYILRWENFYNPYNIFSRGFLGNGKWYIGVSTFTLVLNIKREIKESVRKIKFLDIGYYTFIN